MNTYNDALYQSSPHMGTYARTNRAMSVVDLRATCVSLDAGVLALTALVPTVIAICMPNIPLTLFAPALLPPRGACSKVSFDLDEDPVSTVSNLSCLVPTKTNAR